MGAAGLPERARPAVSRDHTADLGAVDVSRTDDREGLRLIPTPQPPDADMFGCVRDGRTRLDRRGLAGRADDARVLVLLRRGARRLNLRARPRRSGGCSGAGWRRPSAEWSRTRAQAIVQPRTPAPTSFRAERLANRRSSDESPPGRSPHASRRTRIPSTRARRPTPERTSPRTSGGSPGHCRDPHAGYRSRNSVLESRDC